MELSKDTIIHIPVANVKPSKQNYRKTFDDAKQKELNASVKVRGVEQPIWVRVDVSRGPRDAWLIVAGQRRYKAAIAAGHEMIPAIVKNVASDQEALELSIIENDQREDVNPMEQAAGYQRYLDMGKHTPETLAERFGQNIAVVRGRLSLIKLPKEIQKALLDGTIEYGHGLLLTRLKDPADQKEFFAEITDEWESLSVAQAKERISDYTLKLTSAVFDSKTCATCTFRSKAQAGLFPEEAKAADACMDKSCFAKKTREHYQQLAKDLSAKGLKVLTDAKKVRAAKTGSNAEEISTEPGDWNYPKKYKSQCATCENRILFYYEDDGNGRNHFETGEICLDKKCFNAMNGRKEYAPSNPRPSTGSSGSGASRQNALFMRDRFLRAKVPAAVAASPVIQMRLIIFNLLCRFERFGGQGRTDLKQDHHQVFKTLMAEICPAWKPERYSGIDEQHLYAAVETIPEKQLSPTLQKIVLASVPHTEETVLLQLTREGGITLEKHFQVDEAFLNTKTKGELTSYGKAMGLPLPVDLGTRPKPEIVKAILAQKLLGKIPVEISKECKLVTLAAQGPAVKKAKAKTAKATKKAKKK
jgi:ParB/RepB/Spo0J family partition protein